ncbi:MAG: ABC transporter substrate-binding protein [Syntrophomonadaceae bacterium]|nr:ABC transporter substrate-binding protein [Syntrophomonadaceae bacterium]
MIVRGNQRGRALVIFMVLMAFLVSMATGCSSNKGTVDTGNASATRLITDSAGRQVEVPADPQRIACTCPEAGYALALYGKGDKIVATTDGMQRDVILTEMYPHLKGLSVPKKGGAINVEELIRIEADLIFVKVDTINNQAAMEQLGQARIPVVAVEYFSIEEQLDAMQMIAGLVGAEDEGQRYRQFYRQTIDKVQARVADIPDDERVTIYHSSQEATRTDSPNTLAADWTKAAGVKNVSVGEDLKFTDGNYYASLEQILLWDPDYILLNNPDVVGYIMGHEQWRPLQAIKNERVLPLPVGVSRWGHPNSLETPLVTLWTAKTVYPELFADIDIYPIIHDFYAEFFDWDLDQATMERMLKSQGMREPKS